MERNTKAAVGGGGSGRAPTRQNTGRGERGSSPVYPDRPVARILERLQGVKETPSGWIARCPAHDDRSPSLSIAEGEDGRVLLKCFAGCTAEAIVEALGLAMGDLFPREDRDGQPRPRGGGLTVDKLARAKGLPADFVRQFCEPAGRAVRIVYRLANGERAPRQRLRTALKAKGGSRWEPARGPKPVPYGLERMGDARQAGYLVLVEGETDCWTLWYHGFPALGIPGASMAGTLAGEYLEGISRLYVWQEPDKGGEAFVRGVARRLAAIGWSGRALVVRITGVKDPNELHQRNPGAFAQAFREALERAEPLAFDEDEEDSAGPQEPQDEGPEPPGGRPGAEHLTDLGNAKRFVRLRGRDLHYCWPAGKWYVWTGTHWAEDETGRVLAEAESIIPDLLQQAARIAQQAASEPNPERRRVLEEQADAVMKWARACESRSRLEAAVALARAQAGIPVRPAELDADPWLLNVKNGTLDLRTGKLRPHRREDLITKLAPVEYDPAARCPTWQAFLDRIMGGNRRLIAFLQRAVGYALTGDTSEQVLFLLYGTGANGKSTFLETIRALLGDYAQQAEFKTFLEAHRDSVRNDIARLAGARFVSAVEAEGGRYLAEVVIKQLTGGDRITARFLYREFFEFVPQFKLFLAANHKPRVRGTDEAIWRRIRLIPFTVTIPKPERDKKLPQKLRAELPGILNWALEGCLAWQKQGLDEPPEVLDATEAYRAEMDVLAAFLDECCVVHPTARVRVAELYQAYCEWCSANGETPLPQREFGLRLAERGFERVKSTGGRFFWCGVGLVDQTRRVDLVDQVDRIPKSSPSGSLYGDFSETGPLTPLSPLAEVAPAGEPDAGEWEEGEL